MAVKHSRIALVVGKAFNLVRAPRLGAAPQRRSLRLVMMLFASISMKEPFISWSRPRRSMRLLDQRGTPPALIPRIA